MHPKSWILFSAVFTVCKAVQLEPALSLVITNMTTLSRTLLIRNQTQVVGLFLYELNEGIPSFIPSPATENGMLPTKNGIFAPELNLLNNYLVSKPIPLRNPNNKEFHIEAFVLKKNGDKVLEAYRNRHGRSATHAVIYSHFVPCMQCAQHVVNFKMQNANLHIALVYTASYNNNTDDNSLKKIADTNITVVHIPRVVRNTRKTESAGFPKCQLESFQACLLDQLDNFCCFQNESDKVLFVNAFTAQCFPDYNKLCSKLFLEAWFCTCPSSKGNQQINFDNLVQSLSSKPLSNPLQASAPNNVTGVLTCANCLQAPPKSCGLKQVSGIAAKFSFLRYCVCA